MTAQSDSGSTTLIDLPDKLDFDACSDLEAKLRDACGGPIIVDGSETKFLGGVGVELLLAASAECRVADVSFTVQSPSDDLISGLELLGLTTGDLTHEAAA